MRFAIGPPDGLTSNSWKSWVHAGSVYLSCRDNFKEAKVSLHTSGRWRMGFTQEAVAKDEGLALKGQDRAWEVWDEPPAVLPDTVIAFRLVFPTSELAVRPEQRTGKLWKDVVFVEPAPPGKVVITTLFVTKGETKLRHASEPTICLASLGLLKGRQAQLVLHGEPEGTIPAMVDQAVAAAGKQVGADALNDLPAEAYAYFFGRYPDGARFIVGARMNRRAAVSTAGSAATSVSRHRPPSVP